MKRNQHNLRKLLLSAGGAIGGLHLLNKYISTSAVKAHRLEQERGDYYTWKYGRIYYRVEGTGIQPLLLIHDASELSSGWEWKLAAKDLASDFTIYILDLPGCGRSDKPAITYTNYLYAMMIKDFIHDVIGTPAWISAVGLSSSFAVMAGAFEPEMILGLYMINPCSLRKLANGPDQVSTVMRSLLSLPVIGTFIYHIITSRSNIEYLLDEKYYYNPFTTVRNTLQMFYESAHLGQSRGRYFTASLNGRYINWDIRKALAAAPYPIRIFYGEKLKNARQIAVSYKKLNKNIKIRAITSSKMLPHLENPAITANQFQKEFHS